MTILDRLSAEPVPLRLDEAGVLRVGGTRVRLDSVIGAFNTGSGAEEILMKYPSLDLTEIYAIIAYYLWHRIEVDTYLIEQREQVETLLDEAKATALQRHETVAGREPSTSSFAKLPFVSIRSCSMALAPRRHRGSDELPEE